MWSTSTRQHPERRRVLIIGAGPTGMAAAFHLGEHSLLLERRDSLEDCHDHSHDFQVGAADGGGMGDEDADTDGDGSSVIPTEKEALFISCSSTLIHVARWRPPDLTPAKPSQPLRPSPSVRTLRPLLRGELRMSVHAVRVAPEAHLLELLNGQRFVYDKLVSTISLAATERLVAQDLPRHVSRDESLRYWLSKHDVEVVDRPIQDYYGDFDEFAAGKRVADRIGQVLANKFGNSGAHLGRGTRLFEPRLVMP